MGGYLGWAGLESAEDDRIDNDRDGFTDELGEEDYAFLLGVSPEVGCHLWLNAQWRLTASASYQITTDGRANDFLMYGVNLAFLDKYERPFIISSPAPDPAVRETLDRIMDSPDCGTPADGVSADPNLSEVLGPYRLPPPDAGGEVD